MVFQTKLKENRAFFFEELFEISRRDFEEIYFEKQIMHVQRSNTAYYSDFLSYRDFDRYINDSDLKFPDVRLVENAENIDQSLYTTNGAVNKQKLAEFYLNGSTISLSGLHRKFSPLKRLVNFMESEFSHKFQTNVYITPPNAQGFEIHYDTHDVFVLQIGGKKEWSFYEKPIHALPNKKMPFKKGKDLQGEHMKTLELAQGDLLYVPRGVWHEAKATDEYSVHITLGFLGTSWEDMINKYVSQLGLEEEELRAYALMDNKEKAVGHLLKLIGNLHSKERIEKFVKSEHSNPIFQNQQVNALSPIHNSIKMNNLNEDSRFIRTSAINYFIKDGEFDFELTVGRDSYLFPTYAKNTVEFVLDVRSLFQIEDMPNDIDVEGKLNLIEKLIEIGLITTI